MHVALQWHIMYVTKVHICQYPNTLTCTLHSPTCRIFMYNIKIHFSGCWHPNTLQAISTCIALQSPRWHIITVTLYIIICQITTCTCTCTLPSQHPNTHQAMLYNNLGDTSYTCISDHYMYMYITKSTPKYPSGYALQ